jgi:hypothetical protein
LLFSIPNISDELPVRSISNGHFLVLSEHPSRARSCLSSLSDINERSDAFSLLVHRSGRNEFLSEYSSNSSSETINYDDAPHCERKLMTWNITVSYCRLNWEIWSQTGSSRRDPTVGLSLTASP